MMTDATELAVWTGAARSGLLAREAHKRHLFFCMTAAKRAGLPVPEFYLSDNGGLFVMRRFDVAEDGAALGFEDMCALQALATSGKYSSTYERVARSIKDFVSGEHLLAARKQFFAMLDERHLAAGCRLLLQTDRLDRVCNYSGR
jgi:serine/threonine protein kinase HipA of HipAB toxin-antitoxin module